MAAPVVRFLFVGTIAHDRPTWKHVMQGASSSCTARESSLRSWAPRWRTAHHDLAGRGTADGHVEEDAGVRHRDPKLGFGGNFPSLSAAVV